MMLLLVGSVFAQELTFERVKEDVLSKNLELKAYRYELKALEREEDSARGSLFPTIKLEETFTRTDIPAYALLFKLNQERVSPNDFLPSNLNNPKGISNFETKLSLEVPIWLGGKLRALRSAATLRRKAQERELSRKEEDILFEAYRTYLQASLSRSAVEVAKKNVREAEEHLRVAQRLYEVGMALLSDVLRAKVFLDKATEKLFEAEENYRIAKKALSLIGNTDYTPYEVPPLEQCKELKGDELKEKVLESREDLKALDYLIKTMEESYRAQVGDNLPHISAFASYSLFGKNLPFGSDGSGYMFGLSVSLSFNTGLSSLRMAQSFKEKEKALYERRELKRKAVLLEVEQALSEYEVSLRRLSSARARLKEAEEVVRIVKVRYENGLARMVDLLDAQTQLEEANFDLVKALYECNLSYGKALLGAGLIKEVLR